jgi:hypothetical protein
MSFAVYLAVLIVAAASAMFGLDLLTAPLPPKPLAQVAGATKSAPEKLSQRQAKKEEADKQANNRALSPVFPAHPGETKDVHTVSPPATETTGTTHADTAGAPAQAEPKQADTKQVETKQAETKPMVDTTKPTAQAVATPQQTQSPASSPQAPQSDVQQTAAASSDDRNDGQRGAGAAPAAAPVAQQAAGRCDVQACTQAYSSFRASDCTYQPYSGPRRICSAPGSAQRRTTTNYRPRAAEARVQRDSRNWDSRRNPELDDSVRVQQMPYPDDDDDYDRPRSNRRVIVIERGGGFWR